MVDKDYIDPNGYWFCADRAIRRTGNNDGEQEVIVKATGACSDAEWRRICEVLRAGLLAEQLTPVSQST